MRAAARRSPRRLGGGRPRTKAIALSGFILCSLPLGRRRHEFFALFCRWRANCCNTASRRAAQSFGLFSADGRRRRAISNNDDGQRAAERRGEARRRNRGRAALQPPLVSTRNLCVTASDGCASSSPPFSAAALGDFHFYICNQSESWLLDGVRIVGVFSLLKLVCRVRSDASSTAPPFPISRPSKITNRPPESCCQPNASIETAAAQIRANLATRLARRRAHFSVYNSLFAGHSALEYLATGSIIFVSLIAYEQLFLLGIYAE